MCRVRAPFPMFGSHFVECVPSVDLEPLHLLKGISSLYGFGLTCYGAGLTLLGASPPLSWRDCIFLALSICNPTSLLRPAHDQTQNMAARVRTAPERFTLLTWRWGGTYFCMSRSTALELMYSERNGEKGPIGPSTMCNPPTGCPRERTEAPPLNPKTWVGRRSVSDTAAPPGTAKAWTPSSWLAVATRNSAARRILEGSERFFLLTFEGSPLQALNTSNPEAGRPRFSDGSTDEGVSRAP